MILSDKLVELQSKYRIVCNIDLDQWFLLPLLERKTWLSNTLLNERRDEFDINDRLVFTLTCDANCGNTATDNVLVVLQRLINQLHIDISSYFIVVITHNKVDTQFLQTQNLEDAMQARGQQGQVRMQQGYDHSYYFIMSFMQEHIEHHANILKNS